MSFAGPYPKGCVGYVYIPTVLLGPSGPQLHYAIGLDYQAGTATAFYKQSIENFRSFLSLNQNRLVNQHMKTFIQPAAE